MRKMDRREALKAGGVAAAALLIATQDSGASAAEVAAEIARFAAGKAVEPGRIIIELPEIAENGNTVPLALSVDSPMTPADYIAEVRVMADANPRLGVANFRFSPQSGRAEAATRIRLASSQTISVVARTNDGRFFMAQKQVKVTIGGCGG
jgi:sulfur-oxidizing protein SoxY